MVAMALVDTDLPGEDMQRVAEAGQGLPVNERAQAALDAVRDTASAVAARMLAFTPETAPIAVDAPGSGVGADAGTGTGEGDSGAPSAAALAADRAHSAASAAVHEWSTRVHAHLAWLAQVSAAELRSVSLHAVEAAARNPPTRRGREIQRKSIVAGLQPGIGARGRAQSDWDDVRELCVLCVPSARGECSRSRCAHRPPRHCCPPAVCVCGAAGCSVCGQAVDGGAPAVGGGQRERRGSPVPGALHTAQVHAHAVHRRHAGAAPARCPGAGATRCALARHPHAPWP